MSTTPLDPAAPSLPADRIEIAERSPTHPDAARLLGAFFEDQVRRYGFADPVGLSSGEYEASGVFAVVYHNAFPAGCGGYRWFDRAAGHRGTEEDLHHAGGAWARGGRCWRGWNGTP